MVGVSSCPRLRRHPAGPASRHLGVAALGAALIFTVLAVPIFLRRSKIVTGEESLTWYTTTILAFLFAAPPLANFQRRHPHRVWAALLPLAVLAAWRLRIPACCWAPGRRVRARRARADA